MVSRVRNSFNPRLPGGRRQNVPHIRNLRYGVSIHAFRGEGDFTRGGDRTLDRGFNPRLPGGRRRAVWEGVICGYDVSIHAFRGEGDGECAQSLRTQSVSIHAFRGEGDLWFVSLLNERGVFQSTPSGGKATMS